MLATLVNGERSPRALATLGDCRLTATPAQLEAALTGRFRDIHAVETGMLLELIDDLTAKITRLDQQITRLLEQIPGIRGACTSCGADRRRPRPRLRQRLGPGPVGHRTAR